MLSSTDSRGAFSDFDTRQGQMHSTIEEWIHDLIDDVDRAQASVEFQEWLDVQSRFHDYSYRKADVDDAVY